MADRITQDMQDMARSYESPAKSDPLMQDNESPSVANDSQFSDGETGSARDFASKSKEAANDPSDSPAKPKEEPDSEVGSGVRDSRHLTTTLNSAFEQEDDGDDQRHTEMMRSQSEQSRHLSSLNDSMSSVYRMLFDQAYGPKSETYKREQQGPAQAVKELGTQLADQHSDLMKELQDIRYAIMNIDGGLLSDIGGWWGGGNRRNKGNRRGPKPGADGPDRSRNRGPKKGGWWGRVKGAFGGAVNKAKGVKGWKAKLGMLAVGTVGAGAALWGGNELMESASENGTAAIQKYPQESRENDRRAQAGLPPMEGEELIDFRRDITENYHGQVANPETGYALTPLQTSAVQRGFYTPEEVVNVDKDDLIKETGGTSSGVQAGGSAAPKDQPTSTQPNGGQDMVGSKPSESSPSAPTSASLPSLSGSEMMMGGTALGTGAYVMANKGGSSSDAVRDTTRARPTTVRNAAPSANDLPAPRSKPNLPKPAGQAVAPRGKVQLPPNIQMPGGNVATPANKATKGMKGMKGMKGVPLLGAALTAYDTYDILTDEEMSTGEKAGAMTDMGGGLAGAAAGAALGSAAFPVVGTVIGGALGYYAGSELTKSAREWVGGWWNDDDEEDESTVESTESAASSPAAKELEAMGLTPTGNPQIDKKVLAARKQADSMRKRAEENGDYDSPFIDDEGKRKSRTTGPAQDLMGDDTKIPDSPEKSGGFLDSATSILSAIPVVGGAITLSKMAGEDESSEEREKGEKSGALSTMKAMGPIMGAVGGVTSLYKTFMSDSEKESKSDPEVSQVTSPANTQEMLDNADVPEVKVEDSKPKDEVKSATKAKAEAQKRKEAQEQKQEKKKDEEDSALIGTIFDAVMVPMFGSDLASKIRGGKPRDMTMPPRSAADTEIDTPAMPPQVSQAVQKATGASPSVSTPSSASNVTTKAVNETPASRSQHGSVQKVLMVDPTVKKKREEKGSDSSRAPSTTSSYESRSIRPSLDETPAIVTDFGLTLLNTGFI